MKLVDKLKNALFEEEYVEVEEKPKKVKKKEKNKLKTQNKENHIEKPIAKKIVLPERKEVKVTTHDDQEEIKKEEVHLKEDSKPEEEKDFKFPMISDSEFTYEKEEKFKKPQVDNIEPLRKDERKPVKSHSEKHMKPYGIEDMPIKEPEYGAYEKKEERTYFKPSPIISPIYGILDKNYKREDVVTKREVRLTSTYARESLNVDEVRERAYGSMENDFTTAKDREFSRREETQGSLMDNDLLDLSVDTPEVNKVTVGDAEEYFEDLGLEYNVDYKDSTTEKRVNKYQEEQSQEGPYIVNEEVSTSYEIDNDEKVEKEVSKSSDDIDEDNLFDLIDSMYDD